MRMPSPKSVIISRIRRFHISLAYLKLFANTVKVTFWVVLAGWENEKSKKPNLSEPGFMELRVTMIRNAFLHGVERCGSERLEGTWKIFCLAI